MQVKRVRMLLCAVVVLSSLPASVAGQADSLSKSNLSETETSAESVRLYGTVVSSGDGSGVVNGLYSFALDTDANPQLLKEGIMAAGGGFYADGKYYFNEEKEIYDILYWYHNVYTFPELKKVSRVEFDKGIDMADDLAYDATTGLAFGCFPDGEGMVFGSLDPATFEVTRIGKRLEIAYTGIAIDDNGKVYAIDRSGELFTVDKFSGEAVRIGSTGLKTTFQTSAIYNDGKILYGVQQSAESALYSVDPVTAEAVKVFDFPNEEQVTGFFIPDVVPDQAPAQVEGLEILTEGASLSYSVRFNLPDKNYSGGDLQSQEIRYEVRVNGDVVYTGSDVAGNEVSVPLVCETSGKVLVSVFAINDAGRSPVVSRNGWIGNDYPGKVEGIGLSYDYARQVFSISWTAPAGANGGYVDPEQLRYTVVRYPDKTVIAEDLNALSVEDAVSLPEENMSTYYYGVSAVFAGNSGEEGVSDYFQLGMIGIPYNNAFGSVDDLAGFTIIPNSNSFNREWTISAGVAKGPAKSWLITPAIKFETGVKYTVSFSVRGEYSWDEEKYKVCLGSSPSAEAMTRVIMDSSVQSTSFEKVSADFTVDNTSVGFLGFVDYTSVGSGIRIKNLSLTAQMAGVGDLQEDSSSVVIRATSEGVTVIGASGEIVTVYGADGRLVASLRAAGETSVSLGRGIYIVRVGDVVEKVAVR